MTWDLQNLKISTDKISLWRLFDEKIWFDWLDLKHEPEAAKEIAIRNHRRGERVTSDLRTKLAFDPRNVLDMIDVAVGQQQKFRMDIERADPFTRTLGCVEQYPPLRRFEQIAIGFKNTAAKCFVSRRSHCNQLFECSAPPVVYFYSTMPILSRRLALRVEFCERVKPPFHQ